MEFWRGRHRAFVFRFDDLIRLGVSPIFISAPHPQPAFISKALSHILAGAAFYDGLNFVTLT
jgi:hypothetical protein